MEYKNLNSLGKAYRAGNVDRSTYIKQRRKIIDDFTSPVKADNEDVTTISSNANLEETPTIISTATALAEGEQAKDTPLTANTTPSQKSLFIAAGVFFAILALVFFFARY